MSRSRHALLALTLAILAASTLLGGCYVRRPVDGLYIVATMCLLAMVSAPIRPIWVRMRQRRLLARRIVILGWGVMAAKLIREIESLKQGCQMVAGVIDDQPLPQRWAASTTWLGPPSQLGEIVERVRPAGIVIAVADRRKRLPLQVLLNSKVRGIVVEDALECYERVTGKIAIEALPPSALILSSRGFHNHHAADTLAHAVSLVAVAIVLVLLAPLLVAIAVAIKLGSRGPVLFVQERAGKHGRPFRLLKFRTMRVSARRSSEWVRDNVHRITPIGGWLRRFRLDELPQLVNVLRGEMNLVGPRPHPLCNIKLFTDRIAYYPVRSTVRPGVTGWAQVRYGYANDLAEETEKMRYDLYYIKNRSLWLDVRILLRTVLVVLGREGAPHVRPQMARPTLAWSVSGLPAAAAADPSWLSRPGRTRPSAEGVACEAS